jgi:hypothetical protein
MKYKDKKMKPHRVKQLQTHKKRMELWRELNIYNYERIIKQMEEVGRSC